MKNFIFAIALCIICAISVSCEKVVYLDENGNEVDKPARVYVNGMPRDCMRLCEITINGETHEYVVHDVYRAYGMSHWAGCKYCKETKKNIK